MSLREIRHVQRQLGKKATTVVLIFQNRFSRMDVYNALPDNTTICKEIEVHYEM